LDFKSGKELAERAPKPQQTLRQYVSGFANADGGILLVGYDEGDEKRGRPPAIDGAKAPGGGTLYNWASDVLAELPLARGRIVVASTPSGDVLLIATSRSRSLVYCMESRRAVYYLRLGHRTHEMPQSLVTDLLIGRRSEAEIRARPRVADWDTNTPAPEVGANVRCQWLRIPTMIENLGLTFADASSTRS
jgi:hypothetical protein